MKCGWPICEDEALENGMCLRHQLYAETPLPKKQPTPINQVSEKRKEQLKVYSKDTKPEYLKEHPRCEICPKILEYKNNGGVAAWWPVCGGKSVELHHLEGRENHLLNKKESLIASCDSKKYNNGHRWLQQYSEAAMKIGIVITRYKLTRRGV